MLPTKGRCIAHTINRSFTTVSKSYAASRPLSVPLDDDVSSKPKRQVDDSVKVTTLSNGIRVASCDSGGSVTRLAIATNASSRHEAPGKNGLSHILKSLAYITNNERTSLRTVREALEVGGSLNSATTREFQLKNTSFLRSKLPEVLENVAPGFTKAIYNDWDVTEALHVVHRELKALKSDQNAVNMELLHKAAYRNGLGNSLYCDSLRLGSFKTADFEKYSADNFVGNRMTIAATDVSHEDLVRYARELFADLPQGQPQSKDQQKYHGGEVHDYTDNDLTYASLVSEGAGFSNADLPAFLVLQRLLGGPTYVKWGSNSQSSRLLKAAKGVFDGPMTINALNVSYSDSGLFGFNAVTTPEAMRPVLKAAVGEISAIAKGNMSADEVQRAITQAKSGVLMLEESHDDCLDDILHQVAFSGSYTPSAESLASIDKVTKDKLSQVAKKMLSGKPSLVVTGNTTSSPYLDELL